VETSSVIARVVHERPREIVPGMEVGRVLPTPPLMHIGPFVFLDHGGPRELGPGEGGDVPPHPHIGLATVTYVMEGELLHRDSLGSQQIIRPGAINWMTAARGIAHSERTPSAVRAGPHRMHILQFWVGLPKARELDDPQFKSYAAEALPSIASAGVRVRVLAGAGFGATSPVQTSSPLLLAEAQFAEAGELRLPALPELAAFVSEGSVRCEAETASKGTMLVFTPEAAPLLRVDGAARVAIFGGDPLDGPRYIWWNFVSSSQERIVQAARDWREGRFRKIPGDDEEFVPLTKEPHFASP
jgi:redox-sensitive bicupin YhaK (pirin superfamily)